MLLALGPHQFDISQRAIVLGVLDRTPDPFAEGGRRRDFDAFLRQADSRVESGADGLALGGVATGPGTEVGEPEELDRTVPAIEALHQRFDVPISVDTWRATVARASYGAGAVAAHDSSGFADPDYLPAAAEAGGSVVVTHVRLDPRADESDPTHDDVVGEVGSFLDERARAAARAGIPPERIMIDAGLDRGKTGSQSVELLRAHDRLARLGWPVLLSVSNMRFLGTLLGTEETDQVPGTDAVHALGLARGARILRTHDVHAARRVADVSARLLEAWARAHQEPERAS